MSIKQPKRDEESQSSYCENETYTGPNGECVLCVTQHPNVNTGEPELDTENEELGEPTARYRPDSLQSLQRSTKFTRGELKTIYRGFKAECPSGVVKEDTFKAIYSQFFPQGANTSNYAHYVFNTLDADHSGLVSFEEFVHGLSILSRGSLEEKLRWTFSLYDINADGLITRDEMLDIVTAIYELMGDITRPPIDDNTIKDKVDNVFLKMDLNRDGVVTLDEFLHYCHQDPCIMQSMSVFDTWIRLPQGGAS